MMILVFGVIVSVKVRFRFRWPPFGKELLTRLTICSLCISLFSFVIPRFGFEGGIRVLIAPVPGNCIIMCYFLESRRKFLTIINT